MVKLRTLFYNIFKNKKEPKNIESIESAEIIENVKTIEVVENKYYTESNVFLDGTLLNKEKIELCKIKKELFEKLDIFFVTTELMYGIDLHVHEMWPGQLNWTSIDICYGKERSKNPWPENPSFAIYRYASMNLNYSGDNLYYIHSDYKNDRFECKDAEAIYKLLQGPEFEEIIKTNLKGWR